MADALSLHYQYDEAIEIYLSILDSFPANAKMTMAIARVLSWGKNYEDSMQWYDQVIALNPKDPVPRWGKARVAYWGKFINLSMTLYHELLEPPVDQLLLQALQELYQEFCIDSTFSPNLEWLAQLVKSGSIYTGYEAISSQFAKLSACMNAIEKSKIEMILIDYLPLYRIQKPIRLERQAKYFDWHGYFFHALPVYRELADFSPGNEEGLYAYAQDFCSLGL